MTVNPILKSTIIIADDDPVVRHILSAILVDAGYTVITAENGKACLDTVTKLFSENHVPSAIFLDLFLGDMTGQEVFEEIQKISGGATVPAIMLSANSREEAFTIDEHLNVDFFLQKPFDADTVLSVLKSALRAQ